jgi:hypothetical protein
MRLLAAAGNGEGEAQYRLWSAYSSGEDVMRDETEALKWLQRAAEQGHAEAQPYLGMDDVFHGTTF